VVWTDYRDSTDGISNGLIMVFDLNTRQAEVIAGGPLSDGSPVDRLNPDISGDIVVWEDSRNTCGVCPHDIYGFDLASGKEFPVAVGEADYINPSISGSRVIWLAYDSQTMAIKSIDLVTGKLFRVTEHKADGNFRYGSPVIDGDIVVWSEHSGSRKANPHTIYAQNLATGRRVTVATVYRPLSNYDVSGRRVVWTGPWVTLFDLDSGQSRVLFKGMAQMPVIDGELVLWSDGRDHDHTAFDMFGYNLRADHPFLVNAAAGDQIMPALWGEQVAWQDHSTGKFQIAELDLSGARPVLPAPTPLVPQTEELPQGRDSSEGSELNVNIASLPPGSFFKGMHAANGNGWYVASPAATDAIVDNSGRPYFNYFTVLDSDLYRPTGYPSGDPRGDEVGDLFGTVWEKGGYVMVRLWPTLYPMPYGIGPYPDDVAQQYVALAGNTKGWNWVDMVQTNNEPNIEWPKSCNNCRWEA